MYINVASANIPGGSFVDGDVLHISSCYFPLAYDDKTQMTHIEQVTEQVAKAEGQAFWTLPEKRENKKGKKKKTLSMFIPEKDFP